MKKIYILILTVLTVLSCERPLIELPSTDGNLPGYTAPKLGTALTDKNDPLSNITYLTGAGSYPLIFRASDVAKDDVPINYAEITGINDSIAKFNTLMLSSGEILLPKDCYQLESGAILKKGSITGDINITIKNLDKLAQANYILPLKVIAGRDTAFRIFRFYKDIAFSSLATGKKPMPPGGFSCPDRKEPMKIMIYATGNVDIRNYGQFLLKNSRKPVVDMVVLFATIMLWENNRRVVGWAGGDKGGPLKPIYVDPVKYVGPLHDKGIKVMADILPSHQGVGYGNFQSYEDALNFAQICKTDADRIGLDGWDIDEEYADYYNLPSHPENKKSFLWFLRAMKQTMPDKLLTAYDFGIPSSSDDRDEFGKRPGDYLDYTWANYFNGGSSLDWVPKSRTFSYSLTGGDLSPTNIESSADANLDGCYGGVMIWNISKSQFLNGSLADLLSIYTRKFYGEDCEFVGRFLEGRGANNTED